MKKLFSLILVALISSQMWATVYGWSGYGSGSSASMGTIYISTASDFSNSTYSLANAGYLYYKAVAKSGYKFVGWYTSSTAPTSWTAFNASTANPYKVFMSSSKTIYAFFEVDNSGSGSGSGGGSGSSQTKNYTVSGTNYTMNAYDLNTGDNILWGDRAIGATSTTTGGFFCQYGYTDLSSSNYCSGSNSYSGIFTATSNLPADKDVATAALGEGWRMPTRTEWNTLISKSTFSCASTTGNNVILTANSKTITLYTADQKHNGSASYSATSSSAYAYYWTGTRESGTDAYRAKFSKSTNASNITKTTDDTWWVYGQQVIPVYDAANYTLTVKADGTTSTTYPGKWGASTTSITASKSGKVFKRWSDGNTSNPRVFKICNATYTAEFEDAKVTATFNNWDGTELYKNTNVTSGTTPTYGGSTPTKPSTQTVSEVTTYTFTGWSPTLGAITTSTTYTAQFSSSTSPRQYTIRFLMDDGSTVIQSSNVNYGGTPIAPADEDVTKIADESYTYAFAGWDANNDGIVDEVAEVTGAQDYVAVFTATPIVVVPTYNITVGAYSNGTVTLTAGGNVQVVPAEGGVYNYLEGTTIIVKATANRGFHFTEWSDHTTNPSVRVREIDGNKTLTPIFAANTPFTMYDTWDYDDCISNYNTTNTLTVVLDGRTFTAGQWATLSVPFTTTLTADDALYNMVYRLSVATLSQDGGSMHFEFVRTNAIEANEPYLIVPRQAVNEVVFYGVKLETPVEKHPTTDNRVEFVSSLWKQTIHGRNEFYVGANSTLRYASTTGTTVKGNRAFFRKINDAASAPRRVVISIDGVETTKVLTEDGELVDTTTKRMENGILIIERNGVRYDAQGNLID